MATTNINAHIDANLKSPVNYSEISSEPNAVTQSALDEYKEMKEHPEKYKKYSSFDEILNDTE